MGLFSRSVSFCRYSVQDPLPEDYTEWAMERIRDCRFVEGLHGATELQSGWVSMRNPFSGLIEERDCVVGDHLFLTLRVDRRVVPPQVLRKYCVLEGERIREERGIRRISRKMESEIRDRMRLKLLAQALPVPRLYDVCWALEEKTVFLFSCQEKVQSLFEELFYRTFDIMPVPVIPYTLAAGFTGDSAGELDSLRADIWT